MFGDTSCDLGYMVYDSALGWDMVDLQMRDGLLWICSLEMAYSVVA
jgi:hypothetical protein